MASTHHLIDENVWRHDQSSHSLKTLAPRVTRWLESIVLFGQRGALPTSGTSRFDPDARGAASKRLVALDQPAHSIDERAWVGDAANLPV